MAKIVFFTERLPPDNDPISGFSFELMRALAQHQNDVHILTTYNDRPVPSEARLEIIRPFKNWSWLEVPRLMPILMSLRPDILHFIQPRDQAINGWTNAMHALPAIGPLIGRPKIVSSFYDLSEKTVIRHKPLLIASDAIAVSHQSQKDLLTNWFASQGRTPEILVLPAPMEILDGYKSTDETSDSGEMTSVLDEFFGDSRKPVIFVPGQLSEHRELPALFSIIDKTLRSFPHTRVAFGGSWSGVAQSERRQLTRELEFEHHSQSLNPESHPGSRFLVSGTLTPAQERRYLTRAHVVFLASLPPESLRLMRLVRDAMACSAPLILSRAQTLHDPLPWKDGEHALIVSDTAHAWGQAIARSLENNDFVNTARSRIPEFARERAVDQPVNVMSRVYARLLRGSR